MPLSKQSSTASGLPAAWTPSPASRPDERLLDSIHGILKMSAQLSRTHLTQDQQWLLQKIQAATDQALESASAWLTDVEERMAARSESSSEDSPARNGVHSVQTHSTRPAEDSAPPSTHIRPKTAEWTVNGCQPRILLAEDNPVNRELFTQVLAPLGCMVALAKNGREAVDLASRQPFDLILMDIQMPEMDGITATRLLRQHFASSDRRVPIVAVTANVFDGSREACLAAGMDDFLTKPLRPQELIHMLGRFLEVSKRPKSVRHEPLASLPPEDAQILLTLVPLFLEEAEKSAEKIQAASVSGDRKAMLEMAHRLKGSLVVFRESHTAALATQLEVASETASDEALRDIVGQLIEALQEVRLRWQRHI